MGVLPLKRSLVIPFSVLAAVPFVMVLGNSMLIPVFPKMQAVMDLSEFQVGLIITAFSIPAGIVIPFAGAISDHIGRRPVMAPALILYGLGGLIAGGAALLLTKPFTTLLVGRVIQGIGAGGTYQLAMALTGDLFPPEQRPKALGLLESANGLGKVVSPIIGALVALIVWFAPFFLYGFLAIPVAVAVWFLVKEPKEAAGNKQPLGAYWKNLKETFASKGAILLTSYLAGMVTLFLLFGVLSFLSDELESRFNIRGFAKGFVLAVPVAGMAIASFLSGSFLQSRQRLLKSAVLLGIGLGVVGLAISPLFLNSVFPLMSAMALLGVGIGMVLPPVNTLVTSATSRSSRGIVTCLYGTVRFFGVAIGPPAFGLAAGMGRPALFLIAAGIGAVTLALSWFFIKPSQILKTEGKAKKAASPDGAQDGVRGSDRATAVDWDPDEEKEKEVCEIPVF